MEKEEIKSAFTRVKQDITSLKSDIDEIKHLILNLYQDIDTIKLSNLGEIPYSNTPTHDSYNPTDILNPTHNPTVPQEIEGLKDQNINTSTGNEGVPTDRQSNQQTDQHNTFKSNSSIEESIKKASFILDSLDNLKKEIRQKFKRITPQEMIVFSTIYQLEEQDPSSVTYDKIAQILKLSQSSIRDYTQRIIAKGIPIKKQKINNKKIVLSISNELKKVATLSTIITLREI
jgi:hypothetical protein